MRSLLIALALLMVTSASYASASPSPSDSTSELKAFRMNDCGVTTCISVEGEQADVSLAQTSLSAKNIQVLVKVKTKTQVLGRTSEHSESFRCDSFRFDLVTQFLMCDNRASHRPSMTIDQRYTLTKYP